MSHVSLQMTNTYGRLDLNLDSYPIGCIAQELSVHVNEAWGF